MITGQNTEAAGKQGKAFMDTELHGEVGNGFPRTQSGIASIRGILNSDLILLLNRFQVSQIAFVLSQFFKAVLGNFRQEGNGVSAGFNPERWIHATEQFDGIFIPAPPHIARQYFEKLEILRHIWKHLKRFEIFHISVSSIFTI